MRIKRLGPVVGAEVSEIDLAMADGRDQTEVLEEALATHGVLVFRDQQLSAEQQLNLGRRFGELVVSPFSPNADAAPELIILDYDQDSPPPRTDIWHADETYRPKPPRLTILKAIITPELGGDTMFCSMAAAYDGLSDRMQAHIAGLTALHDFGRFDQLASHDPESRARIHAVELDFPHPSHPLVALHPVTGRSVLYVNRHFTRRINGLPEDEGRAILELLLQQVHHPEFQLRVSWAPGTVVMWDNRQVQHYAPHDYWPQRRRMERVTIAGDAPVPDGHSDKITRSPVRVEGVSVDTTDGLEAPVRQYERS